MHPERIAYPVIGQDIPWESVTNMLCRVMEFSPFAEIVSGMVSTKKGFPYASLLVEPERFPRIVQLFVLDKDEFRCLWQHFIERKANETEEILIKWTDKHKLDILVYPKGYFDEQVRNPERPIQDDEDEWLFI